MPERAGDGDLLQKATALFRRAQDQIGEVAVSNPVREISKEIEERLAKSPLALNEYGYDRFGLHADTVRRIFVPTAMLYRYYFRVETHHVERVPSGRLLLIANHSGQFAYDASMLSTAMLLEAEPPRLCRGMGEYFLWKVPWMGILASRVGSMVGTPENCVSMLDHGECVMAFPEGARGANKPFHKRYQLQEFGRGFMRLALETRTPIVPVGIVGAEEQQPGFANLDGIGRRLGLPSLPITISSPWLGLFGPAFALPTKYHIWFGEPLVFEGDPNDNDDAVDERVAVVKESIAELLSQGLAEREGVFF